MGRNDRVSRKRAENSKLGYYLRKMRVLRGGFGARCLLFRMVMGMEMVVVVQ